MLFFIFQKFERKTSLGIVFVSVGYETIRFLRYESILSPSIAFWRRRDLLLDVTAKGRRVFIHPVIAIAILRDS